MKKILKWLFYFLIFGIIVLIGIGDKTLKDKENYTIIISDFSTQEKNLVFTCYSQKINNKIYFFKMNYDSLKIKSKYVKKDTLKCVATFHKTTLEENEHFEFKHYLRE